MAFAWYEDVKLSASIEQGDLINNCPVVTFPNKIQPDGKYNVGVKIYNVIVLTQSCDIENGKVDTLLVCPFKPLTEILKTYRAYKVLNSDEERKIYRQEQARTLANGSNLGYHILDKSPELGISEHLVIDLRRTYGVSLRYAKELASTQQRRIRLMPPYREALSQAYATLFMRVGLPSPIQEVE